MVNSVKLFKVNIIEKIEKIKNNQIKIIKINNINKKEINNDYKVEDFEVGLEVIGDFCFWGFWW